MVVLNRWPIRHGLVFGLFENCSNNHCVVQSPILPIVHTAGDSRREPLSATPVQTPAGLAQRAGNKRHPAGTAGSSGRYWARTSDLRLVETDQPGYEAGEGGTIWRKTAANLTNVLARCCPSEPARSGWGVRKMCERFGDVLPVMLAIADRNTTGPPLLPGNVMQSIR